MHNSPKLSILPYEAMYLNNVHESSSTIDHNERPNQINIIVMERALK